MGHHQTATLKPQAVKNVSITVLSGHNVADALAQAEKHSALKRKHSGLPKQQKQTARQCNVHRAKWNDTESQEQRAAEQAQRDQQIEEAKKVYTTFSELPLEIVVDVRSFTITHLAEPEEIII